jgi:Tfp pilus assembly protein PilX
MLINRNSSQQGFALPIAIGLGITVLLISLSIIVRSHSDNETASAQRSNVRGLNAAEVGMERFQSLINQYRGIAKYPAFGAAPSWQSPTGISTLSSNCSSGSATDISTAATTNWQAIDPTDSNKGQYRLVSYTYDASAKQGALIVEGRNSLNPSTTRLEIKIPVILTASPVPGLWVKESLDTGTVQANLWGSCSSDPFKATASGYTMTRTGLAMPNPPAKPVAAIKTLSGVSGVTLPRPEDISSKANVDPTTGVYQYAVDSISESFTVTPGKKVHLWVEGNINLQGGSKAILHPCSATSDPCSPFDARIYGMATNGSISLNEDTSICDVLIWAPTYSTSTVLNGSTPTPRCGGSANNNGIYWVKSWSGGGQGGNIALNQTTANWSQSPIQPLPKIAPIKSWQREQSN